MKRPWLKPYYSPKTLALASALLLVVSVRAGHAAGEYSVENVVVDASGKDTSDARAVALAKGEKDAFAQLILRVSPGSAAQILAKVTPRQVSSSVRSFGVVDEKMTVDHYHATLNYTFDPRQIQALAPSAPPVQPAPSPPSAGGAPPAAQIPPVSQTNVTAAVPERVRRAVLVLPVYNNGSELELWQDENKWRTLWYDAALESGGGLVIVPQGDLGDRVDVDDGNVNAATSASVKRMYDRYGVGDIIVLQARFNPNAEPKPALEVLIRRLSSGKPDSTLASFTMRTTENPDSLMVRAAGELARTFYKQQTVDPGKIAYDKPKDINARINTNSVLDWQALRKRLLMRSNVIDIKLVSISYYETRMVITFKGTPDMLGKTLVASGLRVQQDGDSLVLSLK